MNQGVITIKVSTVGPGELFLTRKSGFDHYIGEQFYLKVAGSTPINKVILSVAVLYAGRIEYFCNRNHHQTTVFTKIYYSSI